MKDFLKKKLPKSFRHLYYFFQERKFLEEIAALPVYTSGFNSEEGIAWVELSDGKVFYGGLPDTRQKVLYRFLKQSSPNLIIEAMSVAWEIVDRYFIPRSIPGETLFRSVQTHQIRDPLNDFSFDKHHQSSIADMFRPKKGQVCVDVGAFHGYGTMRLAELVGPSGHVVAFETDPMALIILTKNIEANGYKNITVVNKAASNFIGTEVFYQTGHTANSLNKNVLSELSLDNVNEVAVDVVTVDSVLTSLGIEKCEHVSITVNGAEPEVLLGMEQVLKRSENVSLTIAGWYIRDGALIADHLKPIMDGMELSYEVGKLGRVLAWKTKNKLK